MYTKEQRKLLRYLMGPFNDIGGFKADPHWVKDSAELQFLVVNHDVKVIRRHWLTRKLLVQVTGEGIRGYIETIYDPR